MADVACGDTDIPKYAEVVYNFSAEESNSFWSDRTPQDIKDEIITTWEDNRPNVQEGASSYYKMFCGIKFVIKFNYNQKES